MTYVFCLNPLAPLYGHRRRLWKKGGGFYAPRVPGMWGFACQILFPRRGFSPGLKFNGVEDMPQMDEDSSSTTGSTGSPKRLDTALRHTRTCYQTPCARKAPCKTSGVSLRKTHWRLSHPWCAVNLTRSWPGQ